MKMTFSQRILEKLGSILEKYDLQIIEQRDNYLKLCSKKVAIIFVRDEFERSNTLWLGENDDKKDKIEIDNNALEFFFISNLKLSQLSVEVFINNVFFFFENEGNALLKGDEYKMLQLEKFDLERSRLYTQNLIIRQQLVRADNAWNIRDYEGFVHLVDEINLESLPPSYRLKYKIARKQR